jgi:alanine racemase
MTLVQLDRFRTLVATHGNGIEMIHASNSAATVNFPECAAVGSRPFLRLGIGLYGLVGSPSMSDALGIRPVMRLTSRLVQIREIEASEPVSYGATWVAPDRRRIGVVAAGYADGYRRLLSNRAHVGIGGALYPIAGRVCMDMIMVDLGPAVGEQDAPRTGDEVVLMGDGGPSAFELADWAETIPYEICTGISRRVERIYIR